MYSPPNHLRVFRRKSPLTETDIVFLFESLYPSEISTTERGKRPPHIDLLLVYHLLFNTPIESFFESKSEVIQIELVKNAKRLIDYLKKKTDSTKLDMFKIRFLEKVVERLNEQEGITLD